MSFLQTLGTGQGYLKAGFLGFAKSGKTWTAALLAIGVREYLGIKTPVAMFDTEGGSEYIAPMVRKATGIDMVGHRSRSLDDLVAMARECEKDGLVLIADSMTHVWRELCDSYLKQVNERNRAMNRAEQRRVEFQDWKPIKDKWNKWTDIYLNSQMHVVICGRAGHEYDFEERADGSGKDLVKTGIKMKTEGEFGFEPSLLVEMERVQRMDGKNLGKGFVRRATVTGDRFNVIDSMSADDPTFDFFKPHVEMLTPGAHAPIDTAAQSDFGVAADGSHDFDRERKLRVIVCEKIQAALTERWPGQSSAEKKAKVAALKDAFGTASWTEVETRVSLATLKEGLARIESMTTTTATTEPAKEA